MVSWIRSTSSGAWLGSFDPIKQEPVSSIQLCPWQQWQEFCGNYCKMCLLLIVSAVQSAAFICPTSCSIVLSQISLEDWSQALFFTWAYLSETSGSIMASHLIFFLSNFWYFVFKGWGGSTFIDFSQLHPPTFLRFLL